jgi:hypothetical protein
LIEISDCGLGIADLSGAIRRFPPLPQKFSTILLGLKLELQVQQALAQMVMPRSGKLGGRNDSETSRNLTWHQGQFEPVFENGAQCFAELSEVGLFQRIGCGTQLIGPRNVCGIV